MWMNYDSNSDNAYGLLADRRPGEAAVTLIDGTLSSSRFRDRTRSTSDGSRRRTRMARLGCRSAKLILYTAMVVCLGAFTACFAYADCEADFAEA